MVQESRRFVVLTAAEVSRTTRYLGDQPVEQFRSSVENEIRGYITEHYPPGGTLGYVRWCLAGGVIDASDLEGIHLTIRSTHSGIGFAVRVLLSIGLLAFGIGSQTLALKELQDPAVRSLDDSDVGDSVS